MQRVMRGGHNIETDTIRRRHKSGLQLLASYWDAVDETVIFDARTASPIEVIRQMPPWSAPAPRRQGQRQAPSSAGVFAYVKALAGGVRGVRKA
jgi:hypothetical protein